MRVQGPLPLEALKLGRNAFAADCSEYSRVLTKAKMNPPQDVDTARKKINKINNQIGKLQKPDLRHVPKWVRKFFHNDTLKEAINWATILRRPGNEFYLACFLGILHHQRPGFLSYPSSHLVPYLRVRKYPKTDYPDMYMYRAVYPRLVAKIERAMKGLEVKKITTTAEFRKSDICNLTMPFEVDMILTSPPYMNMLDYIRDNRLRIWFIEPRMPAKNDLATTNNKLVYENIMANFFIRVVSKLKKGGHCVLILGEQGKGSWSKECLPDMVIQLSQKYASNLQLMSAEIDEIPDVRRARRNCRGSKRELILCFYRQ